LHRSLFPVVPLQEGIAGRRDFPMTERINHESCRTCVRKRNLTFGACAYVDACTAPATYIRTRENLVKHHRIASNCRWINGFV
jgi:hypothetical protein